MNKADLIDKMASDADVSKVTAAKALDSVIDAIGTTLADGGKLAIAGFGTFSVSERAARKGRNPQTGEEIDIAASKGVKFKAGKGLVDRVR